MDRGDAVYDGVMADTDRLPTYGENVLTVDAEPFRVVRQGSQGMVKRAEQGVLRYVRQECAEGTSRRH